MKKRRKIAFDFSNLHILENYLIQAYRGAFLYAMENNWDVIYRDCYFGPHYGEASYAHLLKEEVDGILFDYVSMEDAEKIMRTGISAVNIGGYSYHGKVAAVHQGDTEIGQLGAKHLMNCFFDNLAFFGHKGKISQPRCQAFKTAVLEAEKNYFEFSGRFNASVYFAYLNWAEIMVNLEEFKQWLKDLPKPVGIMCYHDALAYIVINCCKDLGFSVPHEVAILGVQEFPMLQDSPLQSLSSIDHSARESGYEAAKLLDQIIDGKESDTKQIYVQPRGVIQRASTETVAVSHPVVKAAYEFIRENFYKPITVNDVAKAADTSRATLNRHYPALMKKTIAEEIRHCRLERAYSLLSDSAMSIKEIASFCGFTDASHLSNLFYKHYGVRPGEWRKSV